uniref:Peptidase M14 domain-containing protein n=1 Tax=Eptatretus burgeri TaxID=7764 RepID=A0A8C4PWW5_EPTBU
MTSLVCSIPRWPQECQVINEHIHHIEWSPPQPEPLYVNTKKEATPQCLGEQGGTVVYQADQTSKESYFKGLRIGCSKGSLCQVAVELHGDDDETLLFEARFESGNLEKAVKVGPYNYELSLRPDLYTKKHTQWFYFRVNNTQAGAKYRFTITNMAKDRSLYNQGLLPLFYSEEDARQSCIGWRRLGDEVCYFRNGEQDCMDRPLHSLTWTLCFPHSHDTCYFSYCYPYTYTDLQAYLSRLVSDPARSRFCRLRSLCNTLCGNSVPLLTITAPTKHDGSHEKMAIVVTARVHPGETTGSWLMKGLMDFLLGDSHEAYILREGFLFKIVPMLNPDGVIVGNYRCSLTGCDLNRKYRSELKDAYPGIWHTRNMIQSLCKSRGVAMYFDLHGHSRKNNVFLYGCSTGKNVGSCLKTRVFPMMLSKKVPDQFCYKSCSFKVQKSKEGTGRVVMWRMGILNSFTVETTFSGSTLGNRKGSHFNTKDLESMGFHLCDTLLDYCISDHAKMQQCLKEVSQLCAEEEQEQKNLSSTFHSGSESSTSGSDSSESDGLPAHLQPLLSQVKCFLLILCAVSALFKVRFINRCQ